MKLHGIVTYAADGPGGQSIRISLSSHPGVDRMEFFIKGKHGVYQNGDEVKIEISKPMR
jgi:hypothetical protein